MAHCQKFTKAACSHIFKYYEFLSRRYGKENAVSAFVHADETTPHMHYAFVPVVKDNKKGGYKLSAKEAVDRKDLQTFHKDLNALMLRIFKRDIGILNEATKDGNKSINELKRGEAHEKIKAMKSEYENLSAAIAWKQGEKASLEKEISDITDNYRQTKIAIADIKNMGKPQKLGSGIVYSQAEKSFIDEQLTARIAESNELSSVRREFENYRRFVSSSHVPKERLDKAHKVIAKQDEIIKEVMAVHEQNPELRAMYREKVKALRLEKQAKQAEIEKSKIDSEVKNVSQPSLHKKNIPKPKLR